MDIAGRKLPLVARPAGTQYVRIHRTADGAVWFGWNAAAGQFRPPANRFDAPDRSDGVLYAAVTRDSSFAETIGRKPHTFRLTDELAALQVTTLTLTRELRSVHLEGGEAVGALGATGVVGVGPQVWRVAGRKHYTPIPTCRTASNIGAVTTLTKSPSRSSTASVERVLCRLESCRWYRISSGSERCDLGTRYWNHHCEEQWRESQTPIVPR